MTDIDRSEFCFRVFTVATAVAYVIGLLVFMAAIVSPDLRIDVPFFTTSGGGD